MRWIIRPIVKICPQKKNKMTITAKEVQDLRKMSGAGMMECKSALNEANGDLNEAFKLLREKGIAKAEKKSGRTANEGLIGIRHENSAAAIVEINSETDFVSRNNEFQELVNSVLKIAIDSKGDDQTIDSCKDLISDAVGRIGENIVFKRVSYLEGNVFTYMHNKISDGLGKIGVVLKLNDIEKDIHDIGKNLCMHIAASSPLSIDENDLDENFLSNEREIITNQLNDSGKPENIIEKMLHGKMNKVLEEVTLLKQKFVLDQSLSVEKHLEIESEKLKEQLVIEDFVRYELGN